MTLLWAAETTPTTVQPTTLGGIAAIVGIIGVALTILSAIAFAVLYFKGSYSKATIETLKENNEALAHKVTLLEASSAECLRRCEELERVNEVLRTVVTGSDAIKHMEAGLTQAMHEVKMTVRDEHHETSGMLSQLLTAVETTRSTVLDTAERTHILLGGERRGVSRHADDQT